MAQPTLPCVNSALGVASDALGRGEGLKGPPLDLTVLGLNSGTSMVQLLLNTVCWVWCTNHELVTGRDRLCLVPLPAAGCISSR
jgi:hypothetical protein